MIQDIKGINFRVTLRSDVWPVVRRHDESMDKIEESIRRGIFYRVKIKTYINRRTPGALKYDDFEFTQCLPKEDSFPILHTLVARIGKMAELLNKK